jgi:hypothetical protein
MMPSLTDHRFVVSGPKADQPIKSLPEKRPRFGLPQPDANRLKEIPNRVTIRFI